MKFVMIEAVEGSGIIQHIRAKSLDRAQERAEDMTMEGGNFIVLNEEDYYNLCQSGVGA